MSHLLIRLGFVLRPLSWTRLLLLTLTPACSCVYIYKFQFRPIHPPPLGDYHEGIELMKEIHTDLCGSHIGSRPLLGEVFRQEFYWPKAASDAADLVQKCEGCQKCARDKKQPSSLTQLIQPTWLLQRWGLDLLGPLPPAQGNLRYVVVGVEYFSK